jgi:hypothetical protein
MFADDCAAIKPKRQVHEREKNNHIQTDRPVKGSSTTQAIHTSNPAITADKAASQWIYMGGQKRLRHQRASDSAPKTMIGTSSVPSKSTVVIQPAAEQSNRRNGVFGFRPGAAALTSTHRYSNRDSLSSVHERSSALARSSRSPADASGSSTHRRSNSLPLITSMASRSVSYS